MTQVKHGPTFFSRTFNRRQYIFSAKENTPALAMFLHQLSHSIGMNTFAWDVIRKLKKNVYHDN